MKEKSLRKWHRKTGIILALLMILQAGTGLIFTLEKFSETTPASAQNNENYHEEGHDHDRGHNGEGHSSDAAYSEENHEHDHGEGIMAILASIHHEGGIIGLIYRLATGLGILWMAGTGSLIYFRLQVRQKNR